jgi:hypothetical protein
VSWARRSRATGRSWRIGAIRPRRSGTCWPTWAGSGGKCRVKGWCRRSSTRTMAAFLAAPQAAGRRSALGPRAAAELPEGSR